MAAKTWRSSCVNDSEERRFFGTQQKVENNWVLAALLKCWSELLAVLGCQGFPQDPARPHWR